MPRGRARRVAAVSERASPNCVSCPIPNQEDAVRRISDALGSALAADVTVKPAGPGYAATLQFDSVDEALAFAERLRAN